MINTLRLFDVVNLRPKCFFLKYFYKEQSWENVIKMSLTEYPVLNTLAYWGPPVFDTNLHTVGQPLQTTMPRSHTRTQITSPAFLGPILATEECLCPVLCKEVDIYTPYYEQ